VAKELGATYTVQVAGADSTAVASQICTAMGCQPDIAIECTGAASSTATAIHVRMLANTIHYNALGEIAGVEKHLLM